LRHPRQLSYLSTICGEGQLFMNIVTNGIQDIALSFEKGEGDELDQKPRSKDEGVLDTHMWMRSIITGLWMDIGTLLVYLVANDQGCRWRNAAHWL
ncbi:cation-translocating P-type ATPase C-terminal domain-containing protein, partial [Corynebacterium variabile]|uniref:cation-translocating P-type ATPase C-terminal domain-containing protein n=1 Tax=Corynebacterium variabile TaxID=1727 RepID=UPI0028AFD5C6